MFLEGDRENIQLGRHLLSINPVHYTSGSLKDPKLGKTQPCPPGTLRTQCTDKATVQGRLF